MLRDVSVTRVQDAADLVDIVKLLNEMDLFYGDELTGSAQERTSQASLALLGNPPSSHAIIARSGASEPVGFASYSFLWPAVGSSRSLYLKELYVTQAHRREGIGRTLMRQIFKIATNEGCSRVEWTADAANDDALRFYESIGASPFSEKIFYRSKPAW